MKLFSRHLLTVSDVTSPSGKSNVRVEVMEIKGETVRVEAVYPEALALVSRAFIAPEKLLPIGSAKEGWL